MITVATNTDAEAEAIIDDYVEDCRDSAESRLHYNIDRSKLDIGIVRVIFSDPDFEDMEVSWL